MSFKIVVVNIGQGGGNTIDDISAALTVIAADIVIISEFRTGLNGMVLRAQLDRMGLVYQMPCDTDPDQDAIIMASRFPFITSPVKNLPAKYQHHFFQALVGKIQIVGAHFHGIGPSDPVMNCMANTAEYLNSDSAIFIGSLHTALHTESEKDHSPFRDHIEKLKHYGLIDVRAVIRHNVSNDAHSSLNFSGALRDYALVSPKVAHTVTASDNTSYPEHRQVGVHKILVFDIEA